jgi:hypothetical protein
MLINNAVITGSFTVNGVDVVGITGSSAISSSFLALSSSYVITSASYAQSSASLSIRTGNLEATSSTLVSASSSFAAQSASLSSRVAIIEGQDATTGSNTFTGVQYVSEASNAISFTSTASLYTDGGFRVAKDSFVSGTAYFNNIVVYGTSSIEYITSSQVDIGANIITVNTDTPAVRFGGLSVFDSGSTQLTGSLFWDSEKNHWVYANPSGSSYSGGMLMSGPRSSALGDEQGTLNNYVMKGQGGDHITSSQVIDDGTTVRIPGNLQVTGSTIITSALTGSSATFSSSITAGQLIISAPSSTAYGSLNAITNAFAYQEYKYNGTAYGYLGQRSAFLLGASSTDLSIVSVNDFVIGTGASFTERLRISSTGAATFASSVQINQSASEIQQVVNSNSNSNPSITQYKVNNSSGWEVGMANLATSYSYIFSYGSFGTDNAKFTLTSAGAGTFASGIVSLGGGIEAREGFIDTYHANSDAGAGYYVRSLTNTTGGAKNTIGAFGVLQSNANQRQGTFFVDLSNGSTPARVLTILNTGSSTFASTLSAVGTLTVTRPSSGATVIQMQGTSAYGDTSTLGLCDSRSYIRSTVLAGTANGDTDIIFGTQNGGVIADRMRITKEGKVVINDTFMDGLFGINTKSSVTYNAGGYNGDNANIRLSNGSAGSGRYTGIAFGGGGSTEGFFGVVQNSSNLAEFVWQTYNGSAYGERMRMTSVGNVGIGTNTPATYKLFVAGDGNVVAISSTNNSLSLALGYQGTMHGYLGGISSRVEAYSNNGGYVFLNSSSAWVPASDIKRKRNFEKYNVGLDAILGLQPKLYNMDFQEDGDEKQVGLVAQEVKDFIPIAYEENDKFIGLNYNAIIVTMVNAIQELKAELDAAKTEINELKNK